MGGITLVLFIVCLVLLVVVGRVGRGCPRLSLRARKRAISRSRAGLAQAPGGEAAHLAYVCYSVAGNADADVTTGGVQ